MNEENITIDDDLISPSDTISLYEDFYSDENSCHFIAATQLGLIPPKSYIITMGSSIITPLIENGDGVIRSYLGERTDTFISITEAEEAIKQSTKDIELPDGIFFVGMRHRSDPTVEIVYGLVKLDKCVLATPIYKNQPE